LKPEVLLSLSLFSTSNLEDRVFFTNGIKGLHLVKGSDSPNLTK